MKRQLLALKDAAALVIVCATGKFIGEGFDDSRKGVKHDRVKDLCRIE